MSVLAINITKCFVFIFLLIYLIFIYYFSWFHIFVNKNTEYDLGIPCSFHDIQLFFKHKIYYENFINYSNIVLIGESSISEHILNETSISFIHEDSLVPKIKINEFLLKMRNISTDRDGWYEQQFLKMAYSSICQKDYYLIWDMDTIPIKSFKMFKNGHPIFDMKTEHHIPYFNTIEKLIPGLKLIDKSYISEHMMIQTEFMKNLLKEIELNNKIPGNFFWEKILMSIDIKNMNFSGFSEYETYGTYVDSKYQYTYRHRNWFSLREAKTYFGSSENLNKDDLIWLSKYYQALSFEKFSRFDMKNLIIAKNSKIQKLYKSNFVFNHFKKIFKKYTKHNQTKVTF